MNKWIDAFTRLPTYNDFKYDSYNYETKEHHFHGTVTLKYKFLCRYYDGYYLYHDVLIFDGDSQKWYKQYGSELYEVDTVTHWRQQPRPYSEEMDDLKLIIDNIK